MVGFACVVDRGSLEQRGGPRGRVACPCNKDAPATRMLLQQGEDGDVEGGAGERWRQNPP